MAKNQLVQAVEELTELHIDCLIYIFDYLSFGDFLNIADTCKYLKSVVESMFTSRYSKKIFHLCELNLLCSRYVLVENEVVVRDLRSGLQLLRCFGHLIQKLRISNLSDIDYERVITYMNENCVNSLSEIHIHTIPISASKLMKPYENVDILKIWDSKMDRICLHKIFPNLKSLSYRGFDYIALENNFANMESLDILADWEQKNDSEKKSIENALRMNPQLRSLKAPYNSDARFVQIVTENLPELQNFNINWDEKDILNNKIMSFHFKNMKKFDFKLNAGYFQRIPIKMPRIPFTFVQLEELILMGLSFNDKFFEFLAKNPSLLKLTVLKPTNLRKLNILKLGRTLPMLNEITFHFCLSNPQIEKTIYLLDQIKSLKRCNFHIFFEKGDEDVLKYLEGKWKVSINEYILDIKKIVLERTV